MSSFKDGLFLEKIGRRTWRTTREMIYHVGELGSRWEIVVPKGFETDGASVPRLLWIFWPPFGGDYDQAAVLHDFLYRTKFMCMARVVNDGLLAEAMAVLNTGWFTRTCIYLGVRVGGWVTYWKYRRAAARLAKDGIPETHQDIKDESDHVGADDEERT